jgi:hypothetical protein
MKARRDYSTLLAASSLFYGRGLYGTIEHCPLSENERNAVAGQAAKIVNEGDVNRQWSSSELVGLIKRGGETDRNEFNDRLDLYVLSISLKIAGELKCLGRNVWTSREAASTKRIKFVEAAIAEIEKAGRPLSSKEIFDLIKVKRGIGVTHQLHAGGRLVSLDNGKWGVSTA